MATPRTTVQIIDTADGAGHVAKEVRINDVPVMVAEDGVSVDFGDDRATVVRIDLLPSQIIFGHDEKREV